MTSQGEVWSVPAADLRLSSQEIHVWRAALDLPVARLNSLQQTLSEDELARAKRFHFLKDRQHFTIARVVLRVILGRYIGVEPGRLRFQYSTYGKPTLAKEFSHTGEIEFNLSHTAGIVLYAVTIGRKVGIDIEHMRSGLDYDQVAARFFSPREKSMLDAVPANMKAEAFFTCWVRKEAYIKARGEGLALALDTFDVSLMPGEPAKLLSVCGDPQKSADWSLQELAPGPGYVAALAVAGHGWQLRCVQYAE